ncbi:MAG TPA: tRNA (adenosine(37)-N6)-threonylcarbamoyltransferase complex dimerization subunit type 1 TsaB [Thermoanaerobaculia bacterium]|jgi:tRNA threonylcarbamoyladenosine biosynthesis protein TsaB
MQVLALDTASPLPSVTLYAGGEAWEERLPDDRRSSEELLPAISRCLAAAGVGLSDCQRIAVCAGPGSFTGLRIGLATAWALGRAAEIPVEAVSTLEALAETARDRGSRRVAAALDAGRGQVVLGVFSFDSKRARPESPPARLSLEEARERVRRLANVSLPCDLLFSEGEQPGRSPSHALALAVARAPGEVVSALEGIYSRPSAAEEKRGAP